ncbi:carboxyltransferase domain-containing protein [Phyllobacterium sp. SB3]|uniref:5-oxoprolinase subunit B family protein n=1 Tax=Phyllobacterium sp. SB3 TaxID=3156073 RepID=UPI0032AF9CE4
MIYDEPRFHIAGDRFIEVELGDEMSFDLNIAVHAFVGAIEEAQIDGVVELIAELASFQISYDPERINYHAVVREVLGVRAALEDTSNIDRASRLFYVPLFYFDPWTKECVDDYKATVVDKVSDPDLLCEVNDLPDRRALMRIHSGTEYWVASLGFWPGLCSLMPLDPRHELRAPKYNPPRTWTPKGTIGLGGALTSIYPDRTPGGYQIIARTPMPIWDREGRLPAFTESLALFRPGDRVRFIPIDQEEFDHIDAQVTAGTYEHPCVEHQIFSVSKYRQWRSKIVNGDTK